MAKTLSMVFMAGITVTMLVAGCLAESSERRKCHILKDLLRLVSDL